MLVPTSVLDTLQEAAAAEAHRYASADAIDRALEHARAQHGLNCLGTTWFGLSPEARETARPLLTTILALQRADDLYPVG